MPKVRIGKVQIELPRNRIIRMSLGIALVLVGGLFGWLPILGYWMVPLGLLVLATDNAYIRRWNRKVGVAVMGWWRGRKARVKRDPA